MANAEYLSVVSHSDFPHKSVEGTRAFNLEYQRDISYDALRDDIVSYLGEYRLQVKEYDYMLTFSRAPGETMRIRDAYGGESMAVKARRAITERMKQGLPVHREIAEERGMLSLEDQLRFARDTDLVVYASPPGPKEEGYGNYGFVYVGKVMHESASSKQVKMKALRIENPTLEQFNVFLTRVSEKEIAYTHADQFLESPLVVRSQNIESTVEESFLFVRDKKQKEMFEDIIKRKLAMTIDGFIQLVKNGSAKDVRLRAFHALENYTLALKKDYDDGVIYLDNRLGDLHAREDLMDVLISKFGFTPPVVAGSCGSTGSISSNNILSFAFKELQKVLGGEIASYSFDQPGPCVVCGEDVSCGPCKICQPCDERLRVEESRSIFSQTFVVEQPLVA